MSGAGQPTIETANAAFDESYTAQYPYVVPGDYVMLAVTDTGTGMSPELIDRPVRRPITTRHFHDPPCESKDQQRFRLASNCHPKTQRVLPPLIAVPRNS